MTKKVLIISTSLINNANYEILAYETERGANDASQRTDLLKQAYAFGINI